MVYRFIVRSPYKLGSISSSENEKQTSKVKCSLFICIAQLRFFVGGNEVLVGHAGSDETRNLLLF